MYGDHSPFFIQNIQRKEEAMIIFTSLLTQRLFLCSMIFLERLRKNPAKPIEIKYISYFLQPSSLLFVYLMKALFCKRLFYLPKYFLKHWYIGSDMFSYLIIFVQKYTNQRNTYKKWRLFFLVCNFVWSSIHFSDKDLLQIYIGLFFSLWPNACFYDLLQNSWAWY